MSKYTIKPPDENAIATAQPKLLTKREKIARQQAKLRQVATQMTKDPMAATGMQLPQLPTIYDQLGQIDTRLAPSRASIYQVLGRLTPYLIQRLAYESANLNNSARDRIHATEVLLSRIMPALSAEQLSVDSKDIQNLVIVRASTHDVPSATAPDPSDSP